MACIRIWAYIHQQPTKHGCMMRECLNVLDADYTPRGRLAPRGARHPKNQGTRESACQPGSKHAKQEPAPHSDGGVSLAAGATPPRSRTASIAATAKRQDPAEALCFWTRTHPSLATCNLMERRHDTDDVNKTLYNSVHASQVASSKL